MIKFFTKPEKLMSAIRCVGTAGVLTAAEHLQGPINKSSVKEDHSNKPPSENQFLKKL